MGKETFPKFESLVFLRIRVQMSPSNYGPTCPTLTLLASGSVDPCFQSKIKLEWLGWFKVVYKIVAGSQSESYDSTISRSVGFISSYKVFLKNIKSQKYIRLRQFQKGRFFKRFFSRNRCPKISKRKLFRWFDIFSNSKLRNCCVTLLKHLMKKEKIRNWRNKRFDLINLKREKSADDSTLNF